MAKVGRFATDAKAGALSHPRAVGPLLRTLPALETEGSAAGRALVPVTRGDLDGRLAGRGRDVTENHGLCARRAGGSPLAGPVGSGVSDVRRSSVARTSSRRVRNAARAD